MAPPTPEPGGEREGWGRGEGREGGEGEGAQAHTPSQHLGRAVTLHGSRVLQGKHARAQSRRGAKGRHNIRGHSKTRPGSAAPPGPGRQTEPAANSPAEPAQQRAAAQRGPHGREQARRPAQHTRGRHSQAEPPKRSEPRPASRQQPEGHPPGPTAGGTPAAQRPAPAHSEPTATNDADAAAGGAANGSTQAQEGGAASTGGTPRRSDQPQQTASRRRRTARTRRRATQPAGASARGRHGEHSGGVNQALQHICSVVRGAPLQAPPGGASINQMFAPHAAPAKAAAGGGQDLGKTLTDEEAATCLKASVHGYEVAACRRLEIEKMKCARRPSTNRPVELRQGARHSGQRGEGLKSRPTRHGESLPPPLAR